MNRDNIITLPNSALREKSKRVHVITDDVIKLIEDMESATIDWEKSREHEVGVALAAVQINRHFRVVIVRNDFNNKDDETFQVFINPEIVKFEGEIEEDYEGCLSVKDVYGKVPRHTKVRVKALDINGPKRFIVAGEPQRMIE